MGAVTFNFWTSIQDCNHETTIHLIDLAKNIFFFSGSRPVAAASGTTLYSLSLTVSDCGAL
jgi:hypothetical protein